MSPLGLHIVDDGPRDAVPVVFLHAFPLDSTMWDAQREAVRGKARFIAFDVRGLGKSPIANAHPMLEHHVDDLFAVMDSLDLRSAALVGLSMGGYIALRAAERAPERIRGLMLCDTQVAADSNEGKLKRAEAIRKVTTEGVAAFADSFLAGVLAAKTRETRPAVVERAKKMILGAKPEGIAASLVALATRTDTTASLAKVRVPTHVVVGDEDVTTPLAAAQVIARGIAGSELHVLPGAAHMSNLEAEREFDQVLVKFVTRMRAG